MNKRFIIPILLITVMLLSACSSGKTEPTSPELNGKYLSTPKNESPQSQTHLWGLYDISIDTETREVTAIPMRSSMFTVNVVKFLGGNPPKLSFFIQGIGQDPDYTDIEIYVSITHPFPGLVQYNGYDVRGVFMGNGSGNLKYNSDLVFPEKGIDQELWDADGYTRWFNMPEFSEGGMPIFNYTKGNFATPGYNPTATLCPFRYYADTLGAIDGLCLWLTNYPGTHGVFSAGTKNTRYYYLRFPKSIGIKFAYAVIASWKGTDPADHPANTPEAVCCESIDKSDVWYVDPAQNGGNLKFDITIWDWDSQVSAGVMEDYRIFIESNVLSSVYKFTDSDMTPTGGGENYSTYHVEIPADNITGNTGNEYWVIVEDQLNDYTNPFGVANLADTDRLAAFFRYDLPVSNEPPYTYPDGGWVKTWGGPSVDGNPNDVVVDTEGNVYACGVFSGNVDFDPGSGTHFVNSINNSNDCFINKLDPEGNWVWTVTWGQAGTSADDRAFLIDIDENGYIYTAYCETLNSVALQKFDSDGNAQWGWTSNPRRASGTHINFGLAIDTDGVLWSYMTGSQVNICKYDFSANLLWEDLEIQYDDNGNMKYVSMVTDWANKLIIDSTGTYLWATGNIYDITGGGDVAWVGSFDTTDGTPGTSYVYGVTSGGNTGSVDGRSIDIDNEGHIYIIGQLTGTNVYLAPSGDIAHQSLCVPPDSYERDDYATIFDSSTGLIQPGWPVIWTAEECSDKHGDMPFSIHIDDFGAAYVTGRMRSDTLVFGSTVYTRTDPDWLDGTDVYYGKIKVDGTWEWVYQYGSNAGLGGFDIGYNLYARDNNIYATGYFSNTVDFAPPGGTDGIRTSNGSCDTWVTKHRLDGSW